MIATPTVTRRARTVVLTASLVLTQVALVACSSGNEPVVSKTPDGVKCEEINNPAARVSVAVNRLAAIRDPAGWATFTSQPFDADGVLDDIETVRGLGEYEKDPSALDDALDFYKQAVEHARDAMATPDPASSTAGLELAAMTADLGEFLSPQKAIVDARTEAGC